MDKDWGIGKCDICGESASAIINDVIEVTKPEDAVRNYVIHSGHRFCQEHKRLPREYRLVAGYKEIPTRVIVDSVNNDRSNP